MQQSPDFAEPKPPGKLVEKELAPTMVAFVGVPSTTGLPASAGQGLTPAPSVKRRKNTGQPRQRPPSPPRLLLRAECTGNTGSSAANRGNGHDDCGIGRARLNRRERIVLFRGAAVHLVKFI